MSIDPAQVLSVLKGHTNQNLNSYQHWNMNEIIDFLDCGAFPGYRNAIRGAIEILRQRGHVISDRSPKGYRYVRYQDNEGMHNGR